MHATTGQHALCHETSVVVLWLNAHGRQSLIEAF